MNKVDPRALFARLRSELPDEVVEHVVIIGSLAAAYHHAADLEGGGIKTKDA